MRWLPTSARHSSVRCSSRGHILKNEQNRPRNAIRKLTPLILLPHSDSRRPRSPWRYSDFKYNIWSSINAASYSTSALDYVLSTERDRRNLLLTVVVGCVDSSYVMTQKSKRWPASLLSHSRWRYSCVRVVLCGTGELWAWVIRAKERSMMKVTCEIRYMWRRLFKMRLTKRVAFDSICISKWTICERRFCAYVKCLHIVSSLYRIGIVSHFIAGLTKISHCE